MTSCCSKSIVCIRRILAAVDNPSDGAFEECMNRVIKQIERNKSVFILILHIFCAASWKPESMERSPPRKVFAGVSVLADLRENLLDDDELIRHKGESCGKLRSIGKALDVKNGIVEGIEVFEYGVFLCHRPCEEADLPPLFSPEHAF